MEQDKVYAGQRVYSYRLEKFFTVVENFNNGYVSVEDDNGNTTTVHVSTLESLDEYVERKR